MATLKTSGKGKESFDLDTDIDIEKGGEGNKEEEKEEKEEEEDAEECRVCHVSFAREESMCLGCHCKDTLALAHRRCAEAWFKIKGNRICEICGTIACNINGIEEQRNERFPDELSERDGGDTIVGEESSEWKSNAFCCCFFAFLVLLFILLLFRITLF